MKYNIEFDSEKQYIRADIDGEVELEHLKQLFLDVAGALKKHGSKRVLYDLRTAKVNLNIIELDKVPKMVSQLGIDSSITRALVISDDFKKFNFFESTSRSHGQNVRIFSNYSEAERWLLSEHTSASQAIAISINKESD